MTTNPKPERRAYIPDLDPEEIALYRYAVHTAGINVPTSW